MNILIRVDSSSSIGIGHVMRCMTLATELRGQGHSIHFVCKALVGSRLDLIEAEGFALEVMPVDEGEPSAVGLLASQTGDADFTKNVMLQAWGRAADWLIVDHYGLHLQWHKHFYLHLCRVLVVDDLADREYSCDILLDQTHKRLMSNYDGKVNDKCALMLGSQYVILRPEFSRDKSDIVQLRLKNIRNKKRRVLIMMGGTDPDNVSLQILNVLCQEACWEQITVVLGSSSMHLTLIESVVREYPHMRLIVDAKGMAELMLKHDFSIGAGGGTTWERCSMGLPSILLAFAKNQQAVVAGVAASGAALSLRFPITREKLQLALAELFEEQVYMTMVQSCLNICDGEGVKKVVDEMIKIGSTLPELSAHD